MTEQKQNKPRKLACEILGLIGISALFAVMLYWILSWVTGALVEGYCFRNDVVLTELGQLEVDRWIFALSGVLSAIGFSLLFLALLGDRMAYIRTITQGIHALQSGQTAVSLPLEGSNELTWLAESVNHLSATQQILREKEQSLAREKEQFLRTLSHDIRTPLTSVLAYAEYLAQNPSVSPEEQQAYLQLLRKKAEQIRDLTQLLLDGDRRSPEHFEDARLLMEQLVAGFEEELEETFTVHGNLSGCPSFSGTFDVQELRRIFDNLCSNVKKYADPLHPVELEIRVDDHRLRIRQENHIATHTGEKDSSKLGLNSIRRIAQHYGGKVTVEQKSGRFSIAIVLSEF